MSVLYDGSLLMIASGMMSGMMIIRPLDIDVHVKNMVLHMQSVKQIVATWKNCSNSYA